MTRTKIEWVRGTDGSPGMSWNCLRADRQVIRKGQTVTASANHCEHINEACRFCYADRTNLRLGGLPFKPGHRKDYTFRLDEKRLMEPTRVRRPMRIFVESMSDLFGDWWPRDYVDHVYAVMAICWNHTFIDLTKRPERRQAYLADPGMPHRVAKLAGDINEKMMRLREEITIRERLIAGLTNVIEGVSVSCQEEADPFVGILLGTRCHLRAVSAEPLLGPIDFNVMRNTQNLGEGQPWLDALRGVTFQDHDVCSIPKLDWIIVGGESDLHGRARPMKPEWARDIRNACAETGTEFYFKQWGEWAPTFSAPRMTMVGKKAAGRLLDGREHNGFPGL